MLITLVASDAFERVREGVAEIEHFAETGFALVARDHLRFDLHVAWDQVAESRAVAARHFFHVAFEIGKHLCIRDDRVLDDLRQAAAKFALRQCTQQLRIGEYKTRRVERADEIFSLRQIHAGLAADGAVNLCDYGCWNVDERNATQVTGGDKASEVTDDASAYGYEKRFAVRTRPHQRAAKRFDRAHAFCDGAPHSRRRHKMSTGNAPQLRDFSCGLPQSAGAAENRVGTYGRLHLDAFCFHSGHWKCNTGKGSGSTRTIAVTRDVKRGRTARTGGAAGICCATWAGFSSCYHGPAQNCCSS